MNVLFLCTGNSCRSIMAEAMLRHLAPNSINVQSAGSNPTGYVHPKALDVLCVHNISTSNLKSKTWDNLEPVPNIVITLCDSAHAETCPNYLGKAVRVHWGMQDPAKAENMDAAFELSFNILLERITKFLALPFAELNDEALSNSLSEIAKTNNLYK